MWYISLGELGKPWHAQQARQARQARQAWASSASPGKLGKPGQARQAPLPLASTRQWTEALGKLRDGADHAGKCRIDGAEGAGGILGIDWILEFSGVSGQAGSGQRLGQGSQVWHARQLG
eukprot:gene16578-biopygen3787